MGGVDAEFELVTSGQASALVTYSGEQPISLGIFYHPSSLPQTYLKYSQARSAIYIAEVVVHMDFSGQGIGTRLLEDIIRRASKFGAEILLVDRHTENAGSAGMMRKAGFVEVDCFLDLKRRHTGSRKTTILKRSLMT